jgi:hypothetical protein
MGRSQVLYNRTKGRYKSRSGQPSDDRNQSNNNKATTGGADNNHLPPIRNRKPQPPEPAPQREPPQVAVANTKRRNKYDESILLEPPSRLYKTKPAADDAIGGSIFFDMAGGGSIDIQSMASTLTSSLKVSQRLKVPPHVAQALLHPPPPTTPDMNTTSAHPTMTSTRAVRTVKKTAKEQHPVSFDNTAGGVKEITSMMSVDQSLDASYQNNIPDDRSYSVGTRTRVRVFPDGQVEVRTKNKTEFSNLPAGGSLEDDDHDDDDDEEEESSPSLDHGKSYSASEDDEEEEDYTEDHNRTNEEEYTDHSRIGLESSVEDDDEESTDMERYLVECESSSQTSTSYDTTKPSDSERPSGRRLKSVNTATTTGQEEEEEEEESSHHPKIFLPPKGGALPESESFLEGWLDEAMLSTPDDPAAFSPLSRQPPTIPEHGMVVTDEFSSSVSTISRSTLATGVSSICYTHDSRGKLFDDGSSREEEHNIVQVPKNKKKATKSSSQQPAPTTTTTSSKPITAKKGEDLDAWLDSVIS